MLVVGASVATVFDGNIDKGTIVRIVVPDDDDRVVYRIVYENGVDDELEEEECEDAIRLYKRLEQIGEDKAMKEFMSQIDSEDEWLYRSS